MTKENITTEELFRHIDGMKDEVLEWFKRMLRIPALSPVNGGKGEGKKADYLTGLLKKIGVDEIRRYEAPDTVRRPNIVALKHGKDRERTLYVMTHMDVVPPGELSLWETDPFEPVIKDGKIYARGSEDNGQELIASISAIKALNDLGIEPALNIGLVLVADEETGSEKGIKFLMDKGIFRKEDFIIVPDAGAPDGSEIEIAEKSILWLRITTKGKQCHASTPENGVNAFTAGMRYALRLQKTLKEKFGARNEIFKPPVSTFEPTKKEANVPNVNTIPGEDVFYVDCRILPDYPLEDIMKTAREIADEIEKETGAGITIEAVNREEAAPPTPEDAPVVGMLKKAVTAVYGIEPATVGIGGGTCAAIVRKAGFNAVVWSKIDDMAHQPNEYAVIDNLMGDLKVYALQYSGIHKAY